MSFCIVSIADQWHRKVPVRLVVIGLLSQTRNILLVELSHFSVQLEMALRCCDQLGAQKKAVAAKTLNTKMQSFNRNNCVWSPYGTIQYYKKNLATTGAVMFCVWDGPCQLSVSTVQNQDRPVPFPGLCKCTEQTDSHKLGRTTWWE